MNLLRRLFRRPGRPPAVRPLRVGDAPAVAALHAEGFARGWPVAEIEAMIADPAHVADGLGRGGRVVGFVLSRVAADEAEILSIAVARGERGGGFATSLLAAHLATLAARGARRVFLEVEEGNAPAIALYRRFGFADVGRRDAYYRGADGKTAGALVLRRDLG